MTPTDETIQGLALRDVPILLNPEYIDHAPARSMVRRELLAYDENQEVYRRARRGEEVMKEIRAIHGLYFVDDDGGGRWHLGGIGLHCGNAIQVLLSDGTWLPLRFEVIFSDHPEARNGRLPCFYVSTSGGSLIARADGEQWNAPIFRWPPKNS